MVGDKSIYNTMYQLGEDDSIDIDNLLIIWNLF